MITRLESEFASALRQHHNSERFKNRLLHGEGSHDLSSVGLDNARKNGNGSRDSLLGEETDNSKHGQSTVVDLLDESFGLVFLRSVLGKLERIEKVQRGGVRNVVKGWVLAWLSSLSVVGSVAVVAQLGIPFEETNKADDLNLSGHRKGIPLLGRGQIYARWRVASEGGPREDKVRLDDVSNEGSHSDTAVPGSEDGRFECVVEILDGRSQQRNSEWTEISVRETN